MKQVTLYLSPDKGESYAYTESQLRALKVPMTVRNAPGEAHIEYRNLDLSDRRLMEHFFPGILRHSLQVESVMTAGHEKEIERRLLAINRPRVEGDLESGRMERQSWRYNAVFMDVLVGSWSFTEWYPKSETGYFALPASLDNPQNLASVVLIAIGEALTARPLAPNFLTPFPCNTPSREPESDEDPEALTEKATQG